MCACSTRTVRTWRQVFSFSPPLLSAERYRLLLLHSKHSARMTFLSSRSEAEVEEQGCYKSNAVWQQIKSDEVTVSSSMDTLFYQQQAGRNASFMICLYFDVFLGDQSALNKVTSYTARFSYLDDSTLHFEACSKLFIPLQAGSQWVRSYHVCII